MLQILCFSQKMTSYTVRTITLEKQTHTHTHTHKKLA